MVAETAGVENPSWGQGIPGRLQSNRTHVPAPSLLVLLTAILTAKAFGDLRRMFSPWNADARFLEAFKRFQTSEKAFGRSIRSAADAAQTQSDSHAATRNPSASSNSPEAMIARS